MSKPLIAHIIYRLDYGGLENGLVNLLNHLPDDTCRHLIICLSGYSDFRSRIRRKDVDVIDIGKQPGKDPRAYFRLWKLLRRYRPDVVHTRNAGTIDCAIIAWLAGVPVRVHGCHGWDAGDLRGLNPKGKRLRRLCRPFIQAYISVSRDLQNWLISSESIDPENIRLIYNGVDCERFRPGQSDVLADQFTAQERRPFIIGTVGRLDTVKDQLSLTRSFIRLLEQQPQLRSWVRLAIVGDGLLRQSIEAEIQAADLDAQARVIGWRDDIDQVLQSLDLFCLPSLNEGISNTLLEAMATGLPVIATEVGGNPELVAEGRTGVLIPPGDVDALANALGRYVASAEQVSEHGHNGRRRAESEFSLRRMVQQYDRFYRELLQLNVTASAA